MVSQDTKRLTPQERKMVSWASLRTCFSLQGRNTDIQSMSAQVENVGCITEIDNIEGSWALRKSSSTKTFAWSFRMFLNLLKHSHEHPAPQAGSANMF